MMIVALVAAAAIAGVPNPTVTKPSAEGSHGGAFGAAGAADLAASKYMEAEFFFSGTANAYEKDGAWGVDGIWKTKRGKSADYTVRMLVRHPIDPRRFNASGGVVIVEWLNVTAMAEGAADYMQMKELIEREGYAWVGIGAQASGVNAPRTGLKAWDAERYKPLIHPGDAYAYDIFSQGAQALHGDGGRRVGTELSGDLRPRLNPLGELRVRKVIATGRSQSAFRLVTYINAFHAQTRLFDGYFVHSLGANAAGLTAEQLARDPDPIPPGAHIRADVDVPVFDLQTEGDMATLRAHLTRQDPSPHYRRWEIAGAAHAEDARWVPVEPPALAMGFGGQSCKDPINSAPHHAVVKAGLAALTRWVRDGKAPPQSPAIAISDPAAADPIARDDRGLAKGGIRLPELEAPTARLDGTANAVGGAAAAGGQNFCFLFGHTVPFDAPTLTALYPSHEAFVKKFSGAVDALERGGYLLAAEARDARAAAAQSRIGR
ncbi:MAG TPA: alpha/beta hydrolase domain-containing protein [Vicinamibacterales bacterium]|nr:alpha/beta hydrolase domain-containing protein [Vicinamibacterales bacterium]